MQTQMTNLNSVYTFTGYVIVAMEKNPTGLSVALQILPTNSKLIPRQRVPSHQSLCRGAEEAAPAEKADPRLPCSGCRWLVERDLGANGGWFKAQQL